MQKLFLHEYMNSIEIKLVYTPVMIIQRVHYRNYAT